MKSGIIIFTAVLSALLCFSCVQNQSGAYPPSIRPSAIEARSLDKIDYSIAVDDVIQVFVWQNADISGDLIVRPDGKISMFLAGDIKAAGKTLTQIDDEITQRLAEYILAPQVTVAIKKFSGQPVIVLGEVGKPGVYKLTGTISLMQVLGEAGGLTRDSSKGNLLVIRGDVLDKPEVVMVDISEILAGNMRNDIVMYPNDIVYVSAKPIADVSRYIRDYVTPVLSTVMSVEILRRTSK
ncbi:MAG: polysaccharide biosynthesis/export family protein [Candidatus Brocadiia bacterium]